MRGPKRVFAPLCPDAVFEIASRPDEQSALRVKMKAFLANGARLGVLINPHQRTVDIYEPDRDVRALENPRAVTLTTVLSGFSLDLEPIFA